MEKRERERKRHREREREKERKREREGEREIDGSSMVAPAALPVNPVAPPVDICTPFGNIYIFFVIEAHGQQRQFPESFEKTAAKCGMSSLTGLLQFTPS